MLAGINGSFMSFFITFIYLFICLVALAKMLSTILSVSGNNGHTCSVPKLKGGQYSIFLLSNVIGTSFVLVTDFYHTKKNFLIFLVS